MEELLSLLVLHEGLKIRLGWEADEVDFIGSFDVRHHKVHRVGAEAQQQLAIVLGNQWNGDGLELVEDCRLSFLQVNELGEV